MIQEIKPLPIEEARVRFNKIHGNRPTTPSFPAMIFGGVLNSEDDVRKAEILLWATPRPKADPHDN